eukprot:g47716.t1
MRPLLNQYHDSKDLDEKERIRIAIMFAPRLILARKSTPPACGYNAKRGLSVRRRIESNSQGIARARGYLNHILQAAIKDMQEEAGNFESSRAFTNADSDEEEPGEQDDDELEGNESNRKKQRTTKDSAVKRATELMAQGHTSKAMNAFFSPPILTPTEDPCYSTRATSTGRPTTMEHAKTSVLVSISSYRVERNESSREEAS